MLLLVVCFCNFVSDYNSRMLPKNSRTFFENVQIIIIFPEKFQNTKKSGTDQGTQEWMTILRVLTRNFWEDDILRELGKICMSFPDKYVKCLPNASVAYRELGAPRYSREYG